MLGDLDREEIGNLVVAGLVVAVSGAAIVAFLAVLIGMFVRLFRAVAG